MRILLISKLNTRESYGGSNRAYYLGKYLSEKAEVFQLGVDCTGVDYCPSESTGSLSVRAFHHTIRRVMAHFHPDVVYSFESRANLACWLLKRRGYDDPQFVYDFPSSPAFEWGTYFKSGSRTPESLYRWIRGLLIERIITGDAVIFIAAGGFLHDMLLRTYGVSPDRVFTVPNGAPPAMLDGGEYEVSESPYPKAGKKIAVMIGPRDDYTNVMAVEFLHKVAAELEDHQDTEIAILGGGPQLGDGPNVRYMGYVADINPYLDYADLCLLPYPKEAVCGGARLKSFEYFARKKIVLSTPEGTRGLERFRHLEHLYVCKDDPKVFAREMIRLLTDRERYAELGHNAYRCVMDHHSWKGLAEEVYAILDQGKGQTGNGKRETGKWGNEEMGKGEGGKREIAKTGCLPQRHEEH